MLPSLSVLLTAKIEERLALVRRVRNEGEAHEVEELVGAIPGSELFTLRLANLEGGLLVKLELIERCGELLSLEEASRRLGVSSEHLLQMVSSRELCVLEDGGLYAVPGWQLTQGGRLLDGLSTLYRVYPGGEVWSFLDFMLYEHPLLGRHTPLELLRALNGVSSGGVMMVERTQDALTLEELCDAARHDFEHGGL